MSNPAPSGTRTDREDLQGFYQWVASTDRVVGVEFVFKRPNPDAEREFEELFARMNELEASQIGNRSGRGTTARPEQAGA